jgi:phage shock protein C
MVGRRAARQSAPMTSSPKKLTRSTSDRMLGGVAAGLADYLGVETVFVRVGFVVATVMSGAGAVAYLALLLLMPAEDDPEGIELRKDPLPV